MFWCITFSGHSISDDVRDVLLETAYLMIRGHQKRRRFRSTTCEGVVETKFQHMIFITTSGFQFQATVECEVGKLNVLYLVNDSDLHTFEQGEYGVWLSDEDLLGGEISEERIRPNPIKKVAHGYN